MRCQCRCSCHGTHDKPVQQCHHEHPDFINLYCGFCKDYCRNSHKQKEENPLYQLLSDLEITRYLVTEKIEDDGTRQVIDRWKQIDDFCGNQMASIG